MSVRQVMEHADHLIRTGQLPGKEQVENTSEESQKDSEDKNKETSKNAKKRFWMIGKKVEKEAELKVKIDLPAQIITLSMDDFDKFAKVIIGSELHINKIELIKFVKGEKIEES